MASASHASSPRHSGGRSGPKERIPWVTDKLVTTQLSHKIGISGLDNEESSPFGKSKFNSSRNVIYENAANRAGWEFKETLECPLRAFDCMISRTVVKSQASRLYCECKAALAPLTPSC